jgi:hypothetical protein
MSPNRESRWTTWGTVSGGFREIEIGWDRLGSVGVLAPFLAPAAWISRTEGRKEEVDPGGSVRRAGCAQEQLQRRGPSELGRVDVPSEILQSPRRRWPDMTASRPGQAT